MSVVKGEQRKLFYRINEVSRLTGIKPYVLRYWESEFDQLSPQKDTNDQRRYRQEDIDLIERIKRLLYDEKFTIAGAKKRLRQPAQAAAPAPGRSRAERLKGVLSEIAALRADLNELIGQYS